MTLQRAAQFSLSLSLSLPVVISDLKSGRQKLALRRNKRSDRVWTLGGKSVCSGGPTECMQATVGRPSIPACSIRRRERKIGRGDGREGKRRREARVMASLPPSLPPSAPRHAATHTHKTEEQLRRVTKTNPLLLLLLTPNWSRNILGEVALTMRERERGEGSLPFLSRLRNRNAGSCEEWEWEWGSVGGSQSVRPSLSDPIRRNSSLRAANWHREGRQRR